MRKFAVFTAIIGGYDSICDPLVIDDDFDYYLFSDHVEFEHIGVWNVRKVEYQNEDPIRVARYVKTHPEELLSEYNATLWMDANLRIVDNFLYEKVKSLDNSDIQVASVRHPLRDCAYHEAFAVSELRFEHSSLALRWCRYLWKNGYPLHQGLFETNILYRKKSPLVSSFDEEWWSCIEKYSKRDQLSCNYCLWKHNVPMGFILPHDTNARDSNHVNYLAHDQKSKRKFLRLNLSERVRLHVWRLLPRYSYRSFLILRKICCPSFFLFLWGWLSSVMAFPVWVFRKCKRKRSLCLGTNSE